MTERAAHLVDLFLGVNAFHMTGSPYFMTLCEVAAGAVLNARLLYLLDAFVRRKWYDA
jgi:hypothetical protein